MLNLLFLWFSVDPVWPCCTHVWTPGVPAGVRRSDPEGCPPEPWGTWTCHNSQSGSWLLWPANINSNFFFIRIISLCNTLLNIHYLSNFAVCKHAHYQWVQYFRNKQFFIFVLLLWCFDTQVHWCTNNKDRALYTSTHRQHPLQGGEPHLLQGPLLWLLLICKITISYSLKLCLHVLYSTYFNSYTCICQWCNHTLNFLMDNPMHINMIIYFTQIK